MAKVDVPCGLKIIYQDLDLCQSVRSAMGNVGKEFINKLGAMCQCLPEAFRLAGSALSQSIMEGGDMTGAASKMIGAYMKLEQVA